MPWAASAAAPQQPTARTASPQVILDWSETAVATVHTDAKRPVPEQLLWYGFVSAAVYNAVVGIEGRYTPYKWHERGPRGASSEAAAAAAAHRVLLTYFPASQARLDAALTASLAKIPDGRAEDKGVAFGERAAARIVQLRENDGRGAPVTYDRPPAPGVWRPTLPANAPFAVPWLGQVRPMLLDSPDQFLPGAPPTLTSKAYTREFAEVKAVGARTGSTRTAQQTETARFFSDALPLQVQAANRGYVQRHGLGIVDAARLFAATGTAMADATITGWNAKFTYAQWRPITAIQLADTDGNPATAADPSWLPLLDTPPYPDWVSGHNVNDGAVMSVLNRLTGGDIDFRISSAVTGTSRTYTSAADYNRDVIDARVWGGLHFRSSDVVANRTGGRIGSYALAHYFKPIK
ncbi:vanadium-dependent haloperoxidase [Streptomyces fulvoviolaceus]|uniref:vanadium-dependent haloperoxidase n=1 Tax=Streptomyces fulvoviolaceus TaxID=285535 RepID=UPI0021BFF8A9|nr:vanadium-dependent haloperoxidase [Streptomyces fulvoviolaceus]MCT9080927.1 vanadium-dependent haloperoxidase [Streptomyces fulvoviolaceus]